MSLNRLGRNGQKRSRRQEERIAEESDGVRTPMSGAGWFRKNDVRAAGESWELKTTSKMQYALKALELSTAWTQATIDRRRMVFGIEFGDGEEYVVLRQSDYTELRDRAGS